MSPTLIDPTGLLVAGDSHADPSYIAYLYETAVETDCQGIVLVGDFGYLEHYDGGAFLDVVEKGVELTRDFGAEVKFFWIDGNHENHTMLREKYGPGGTHHKLTEEGFWEIRPGVYYIPRATRWQWAGVRFLGLGGAYSVDKAHLLRLQRKDGGQRWWPEEEITDGEVRACLADSSPVDVMFTHDKPRDVTLPWTWREIAHALPNQNQVQRVVDRLHPKLLVHGHLHRRYTAKVDRTVVEGLACNPHKESDNPQDAWLRLSLV